MLESKICALERDLQTERNLVTKFRIDSAVYKSSYEDLMLSYNHETLESSIREANLENKLLSLTSFHDELKSCHGELEPKFQLLSEERTRLFLKSKSLKTTISREEALAVKEQEDRARRAEIEELRKADEEKQKELDEARCLIKGKFAEGERPSFGDSSRSPTPVLRLAAPPLAEEVPGYVSEAEHQMVITSLTTQIDALQREVTQYKQTVATRDLQLEIALRRVRELEETCRSQAQPSKRRHDDPDDSAADPHEGEVPSKRLRLDLPSGSGTAAELTPNDTAPPTDPPADPADRSDSDDDDIPPEAVNWVYEPIPVGTVVQFPHEKVTPAVNMIDPNTAPTDPSELHITEEARRILNQHAQSLRFWKRTDDIVTSAEYDTFLPTVQTPEEVTTLAAQQPIRLGWNHTVIFRPFLEESFSQIFQQESLHTWSQKVFFDMSHMKKRRRRTAYVYQRKLSWKEHGQIRRKLRFTKVTDVRPYKFGHQLFLEFHVRMYNPGKPDGNVRDFMFTEADLDSIDLEDLLTLIRHLEGPILKPDYFRDGLEILKRKNQRRFMRFSELSSFCDGTLLYVYNGMKRRLLENNMPMHKGSQWKSKLIEALDLIENKLKERLMLRRVETAMELRTRTIREWDEYMQLSQWEPALNSPFIASLEIHGLTVINGEVITRTTSLSDNTSSSPPTSPTPIGPIFTPAKDPRNTDSDWESIKARTPKVAMPPIDYSNLNSSYDTRKIELSEEILVIPPKDVSATKSPDLVELEKEMFELRLKAMDLDACQHQIQNLRVIVSEKDTLVHTLEQDLLKANAERIRLSSECETATSNFTDFKTKVADLQTRYILQDIHFEITKQIFHDERTMYRQSLTNQRVSIPLLRKKVMNFENFYSLDFDDDTTSPILNLNMANPKPKPVLDPNVEYGVKIFLDEGDDPSGFVPKKMKSVPSKPDESTVTLASSSEISKPEGEKCVGTDKGKSVKPHAPKGLQNKNSKSVDACVPAKPIKRLELDTSTFEVGGNSRAKPNQKQPFNSTKPNFQKPASGKGGKSISHKPSSNSHIASNAVGRKEDGGQNVKPPRKDQGRNNPYSAFPKRRGPGRAGLGHAPPSVGFDSNMSVTRNGNLNTVFATFKNDMCNMFDNLLRFGLASSLNVHNSNAKSHKRRRRRRGNSKSSSSVQSPMPREKSKKETTPSVLLASSASNPKEPIGQWVPKQD
ncbi:hypothetical protein OSB04_025043 [Centaurea solstitialis]|uniref:Uncharacterized protein n=1 Tax=Centaurea solstitialis TaxID=347529 RepID=A0AA38SZ01_9ASTR|nr:hypothetical protein OSB04_025043 [Centaurea solstitialis]